MVFTATFAQDSPALAGDTIDISKANMEIAKAKFFTG